MAIHYSIQLFEIFPIVAADKEMVSLIDFRPPPGAIVEEGGWQNLILSIEKLVM